MLCRRVTCRVTDASPCHMSQCVCRVTDAPPCHMSQCVCRVTDAPDGSSVCEWFLIRMNKGFNFSQLICFNNVKGVERVLHALV
jgi:hypothetical protein